MNRYYFTSESVSEGHPDKVADQISDAILDEYLRHDRNSKVACETLVTTGLVMLAGEVKSSHQVDVQKVVRRKIAEIGYTKSAYKFDAGSCAVISTLHEQSGDINRGVEKKVVGMQGAGDQGMMFGYATNETEQLMPLPIVIANAIVEELAKIRKSGEVPYLRPDSKSQVTVEYDADTNKAVRIDTIVVSTQHDDIGECDRFVTEEQMHKVIENDVRNILLPRVIARFPEAIRVLFKGDYKLFVNPTGKFVIGGPHGDTGLTGRKIIVDTYGGRGAHGGGAFSGKDPSKVDRSAAYAARHIAKNLVGAGVCEECLVQISYAIGVAQPVGVYVNTYGTAKVDMSDGSIAEEVSKLFDLRPAAIIANFGLQNPIYEETAAYGHFGRTPYVRSENGREYTMFSWEKLDMVGVIKAHFFK